MTTQNETKSFFDLHINGLGYLNRIRQVTPKRGDTFLACDISALNGPSDDVSYTKFDCRVSGREAESLVKRCEQSVNMDKKVLIGFKLGDLWTDVFVFKSGKKQGQTGVSLKARLLFISWIKIDGKMVYQAPSRDQSEQQTLEQPQPIQNESTPVSDAQEAAQIQQPVQPTHGYSAGSYDSPVMH